MHKLTKGLKKTKKKKKGKKKGREEELFDAAELEEYRRTHQQQQQQEDGAPDQEDQGAEADEWRQFKALTAGVDTVLRKTQDDLDRIRSTSYFQRKKPESEAKQKDKGEDEQPSKKPEGGAKKWVGFEEGAGGPDQEEASAEPTAAPAATGEASGAASAAPKDLLTAPETGDLLEESAAEESSEEEEEEEDDDGLFDTSYVDAVTSGEVKLAYIPDSPELEVSGGADDPFDTSYVESIAKQAEEDLKKRPAVVLDSAVVKVLAGRAPPASTALKRPSPSPKRQPRAADVDLLLASFDENGNAPAAASEGAPVEPAPKSLLDDLDDVPAPPTAPAPQTQPSPSPHPLLIDALGASASPSPLPTTAPDHDHDKAAADDHQPGSDLRDLVAEFDLISAPDSTGVLTTPAALSEPSVKVQVVDFPDGQDEEEEDLDDEFAALAKESVSRKASYQPPADGADQDQQLDLDLDLGLGLGLERDPFDTSVAAAVLGEQTAHDSFDSEVAGLTDQPPALPQSQTQGRKPRAFPISPDVDIVLASDSPSSWAAFDDDAEEPTTKESKPARPPPPSAAPARGQQETFHESELRALAEDLVAPDPFDTSFAEGILPGSSDLRVLEEQLLQGNQDTSVLSSVSIHVTDPAGEKLDHSPGEEELNSLTPSHRDLLGGSTTDLSKLGHDPIEPAAGAADEAEEVSCFAEDPFDTSVVERVAAPGKAEVRYLEEELLGGVTAAPERRLSDPDFDPRAAEDEAQQQATAVVTEVVVEAEAAVQKRPDLLGAATKVVSFDLPTPSERPDLLAVEEDKAPIAKPLTPYYPEPKTILDDIARIADPFDTSFAENIAPGRAELRLLENELLEEGQQAQQQPTLRHSLSDPDFDPRGEEKAEAGQQQPGGEQSSPEPVTAAAGAVGRRRSELVTPAPPPADSALRRRFSDVTGDRGPRARALQPPDSLPLALSPIQGSRPDLLLVEEEDAAATAKPLTPISRGGQPALPVSDDPFDTSAVAGNLLPGKAELKVLESELIGGPLKRSYTDPDFDPRASDPEEDADRPEQSQEAHPDQRPATPDRPDLLNLPPAESQLAHKPLTPTDSLPESAAPPVDGCDVDDPFDTSIVDGLVAPGRAELRALESELIGHCQNSPPIDYGAIPTQQDNQQNILDPIAQESPAMDFETASKGGNPFLMDDFPTASSASDPLGSGGIFGTTTTAPSSTSSNPFLSDFDFSAAGSEPAPPTTAAAGPAGDNPFLSGDTAVSSPFLLDDAPSVGSGAISSTNPFAQFSSAATGAGGDINHLDFFSSVAVTTAPSSASAGADSFGSGAGSDYSSLFAAAEPASAVTTSAASALDFFGGSADPAPVAQPQQYQPPPRPAPPPVAALHQPPAADLLADDAGDFCKETSDIFANADVDGASCPPAPSSRTSTPGGGRAPRRPPPPRPQPPKETKDLILSVTGAMEATSSHLLDRLKATRTPSPTPMRDLHSPSPTPDMMLPQHQLQPQPQTLQPQSQHAGDLLLGVDDDDLDLSGPAPAPPPTPQPAPPPTQAAAGPPQRPPRPEKPPPPAVVQQQQQQDFMDIFGTADEQPPTSVSLAQTNQAPARPSTSDILGLFDAAPATTAANVDVMMQQQQQQQPPPRQPSGGASPVAADLLLGDAFGEPMTSAQELQQQQDTSAVMDFTGVPTGPVAAESDHPVADFDFLGGPAPGKLSPEPPAAAPAAGGGGDQWGGGGDDMLGGAVADRQPSAPHQPQAYNPGSPFAADTAAAAAAAADDFDAFTAKFESAGAAQQPDSVLVQVGGGGGGAAEDPFDPFGGGGGGGGGGMGVTAMDTSADDVWGDSGAGGGGASAGGDASGAGFGAEDSFDAFLSLSEPPPPPQGTPARFNRTGSADSDEAPDFSIFIRPKGAESNEVAPQLAPPPKSPLPAPSAAEPSRFNPFDKSSEDAGVAVAATAVAAPGGEPALPQGAEVPDGMLQRTDSQETPPTPLFDEDVSQPLEPFPRTTYQGDGWEMHLRQPNKKKITGQRFWKKVFVRLVYQGDSPVLQLFNTKDDKDPFQELPLQPCYSVSDVGAQQFDQYGKIFTVKLQYVFYKERPGVRPGQVTKAERLTTRISQFAHHAIQGDYQGCKEFGSDLRKLGLPVEHAPQISQLFKIGCQNYEDIKQFGVCVEEALFRLSAHRDRALNYKTEEVQITAVDELYVEQDAHGHIDKQIARVRLFFLGFLAGMPDVELGVNDLWRQGKEVVGRHDIIPVITEEWIRLEGVEFHSCVQQDEYEKSRIIKFKPPDACYIELMRFRVRPPRNRELPLQVKAVICVTGNKVEIKSEILVPGFSSRKLGQIPCEDIMVRFPIPECWIYLFRVEKHFRYGSVKSAHRRTGKVKGIERILGAMETLEPSLIEVTSGQAKYEHQHRSIVWRMARLPKEGQGAYTTHSFVCRLGLTSYDQIPEQLAEYCYVEFTMPATQVSHTTVRSVSLCNGAKDDPPEKYVRYLARHEYRVGIEHTQGEGPGAYVAATITTTKPPPAELETLEEKEAAPAADSDSDSSS
ncbi:uncharacterized protein LOC126424624 [Schistocerca serialis cubense]|uniref:uncharacterized protein LOC126424624 n=1 Tax=Schistocerca serialis cubense TaxID=2023355 RepID=UPI00214E2BEA|nr:uncharacterized protein LOC126424624 [Schistocerca serialis cubense]